MWFCIATEYRLIRPNQSFDLYSALEFDQTMADAVIRIATRKSPLALWQANWVAGALRKLGHSCELVPLTSVGDADLRPISSTTEVGIFTKRIQQAIIDGEADIAVHSLKDLPTAEFPETHVAAIPQRADVHDRLVSIHGYTLESLPPSAMVGTSSRRRAAQLLHARPDLKIQPIRGNVQTRLDQVTAGHYHATVLAAAGLDRLDLPGVEGFYLPLDQMLPAPGQAALAIETRRDDTATTQIAAQIDDVATRACVTAERSLLRHLSGGCLAPIAAYGRIEGETLALIAVVLSVNGTVRLVQTGESSVRDAVALGQRVGGLLLDAGADRWIDAAR